MTYLIEVLDKDGQIRTFFDSTILKVLKKACNADPPELMNRALLYRRSRGDVDFIREVALNDYYHELNTAERVRKVIASEREPYLKTTMGVFHT